MDRDSLIYTRKAIDWALDEELDLYSLTLENVYSLRVHILSVRMSNRAWINIRGVATACTHTTHAKSTFMCDSESVCCVCALAHALSCIVETKCWRTINKSI